MLRIIADKPAGAPKTPQWLLTAFRADDGTVYAPAAAAGREKEVLLCAGFDGVGMYVSRNHVYLPVAWLRSEYPSLSVMWDAIERRAQEAHRAEQREQR